MLDFVDQAIGEFRGSWRFRWAAAGTAWVVCILGWLGVYTIPNIYETEAKVYVDTSSALRPLLEKMTIDTDVLERVELVTQAMLGRPLLERVARETDLYLRAKSGDQLDDLIEIMRKEISISHNDARDPNLYSIRYRDVDPNMAQAVVESMLKIFIEDSVGANQFDTTNAQEFLRAELQALQLELEASEAALAEFKKQNVGRMPDAGGSYYDRMQRTIDELERTQSDLRIAARRRDTLLQQLSGEQPTLDPTVGGGSDLEVRIAENEARLEELQLRFTDLHPDVIAVEETLEQLYAQQEKYREELKSSGGAGVASDNPVYQNIQIELTNVNVRIEMLREQESTLQRRIEELRRLIDVLPQVEAELARLTRNYDVKQSQYQLLLQRLDVAELSESAEQSQDVQFQVIEPPVVPSEAVAPNRPVLLAGVLLVGLGAGCAVAIFLNQLKPVFSDVRSLRSATGLPVLGTIALLQTSELQRARASESALFAIGMACLCLVFVFVIWFQESGALLFQSALLQRGGL